MSHKNASRSSLLGAALLLCLTAGMAQAEDNVEIQQNQLLIEESAPVTPYVFEGDLRELSPPTAWKPGDSVREIPRRFYPKPGMHSPVDPSGSDPLAELQQQSNPAAQQGTEVFTTPSRTFAGIGYTGVNPPDPSGAAGPSYYIQMINGGGGALVRIFDKAIPTPNVVADFSLESLGSGSCASGFGDPIVIYDRQAQRWMLSEFSSGGNNLCMYVSQTSDPVTGGWFAYQFSAPSFPDYPKYGTWPTDANGGAGSYIVTANDGGPGVYAMDRGNMLAGNAATFVRIAIPGLPGFGFEAPTPADIDGQNMPPVGAPAVIMRHRDTESHSGPSAPADLLEMWTFDVDWLNTGNSVLQQELSIDVAEFDSSLCGLTSFNCFPQPGTGTTLDPLREVIMNRLQYVNHNDGFETLVGSFVVDVNGANLGGVRWFELRGGSPSWTLHQEGTYSIDSDNRWMSSAAMDQSQNLAIAYNVSSGSTFPGLRYTGRLSDDPLGTMSQPESVIIAGTASNGSNRYGDYSQMSLDPADDCTFWFTGEANTASQWRTQIGSFAFEACGCDLFPGTPTLSAANNGDNRVDLDWDDSDLDTVSEYRVLRSRTPGGPYTKIATLADSTPGVGGGLGYSYSDLSVSGGVDYYYVVRSSDAAACTSPESNEVPVTATGICILAPVFSGVDTVQGPQFGVCTLELTWSAAAPECGPSVAYNVYRSTTPGFAPGPGNQIASGLTDTALADLNQLVDTSTYFYIVRAVDTTNGVEETNSKELSASPNGVGGAMCTTGSACADNPFVDVNPEGPLTVCQGAGPTLVADLVSGTGPFDYQWIRDGVVVPDETTATFAPDDLGLHTYNVRVSAQSCPDEVFDGLDTVLDRVNQPFFGGATGAINTQGSDCSVDVNWTSATTVCDGPVTYNIYRDTTNPVVPSYGNLVAGGVSGTTYTDTYDLADSQTYFYLVRAFDNGIGRDDGNGVVVAATPDGPNNGLQDAYLENYTVSANLNDWTITTGPGPHTCGAWAIGSTAGSRPAGGAGNYMIADNRCSGLLPRTSTTAESPAMNLVIAGVQAVTLQAKIRFDYTTLNTVETGRIDVWDGSQWIAVWNSSTVDLNQTVNFDVSAYAIGNPGFKVRFDYQNATADQYFSVDDVRVITDVVSVCATEAAGPPSVPRGSLITARNGVGVDVTWDAGSCAAGEYNLLYGDLANVGTYALQGSVCGLGGAGSYSWTSLPSGNLFFLVVGTDGAGTEGSWGHNSGLGERNGGTASNECGANAKNPTHICN